MFGEESLLDEEDINGPGLRAVRQATACCLRDSELVKIMPPPSPPRTKWTRRVPHPVLIGHDVGGRSGTRVSCT